TSPKSSDQSATTSSALRYLMDPHHRNVQFHVFVLPQLALSAQVSLRRTVRRHTLHGHSPYRQQWPRLSLASLAVTPLNVFASAPPYHQYRDSRLSSRDRY